MTGGPGVCGPGSIAPSSTADPHAREEAAQELLVVGYVGGDGDDYSHGWLVCGSAGAAGGDGPTGVFG